MSAELWRVTIYIVFALVVAAVITAAENKRM